MAATTPPLLKAIKTLLWSICVMGIFSNTSWAGSPGLEAETTVWEIQYLGSPSRQIDRVADTIDVVFHSTLNLSSLQREMIWSDARIAGAVTNLTLDNGDVVGHVPIGILGGVMGFPLYVFDSPGYPALRSWPNGSAAYASHFRTDDGLNLLYPVGAWLKPLSRPTLDWMLPNGSELPLPVASQHYAFTKLAISESGGSQIYHVIASSDQFDPLNHQLTYYWRGILDTLAPSITWSPAVFMDSVVWHSATIEASPVSDDVAILYNRHRPGAQTELDADMWYVHSGNDGVSWSLPTNITQYANSDPHRAYPAITAAYDLNNTLHAVYSTVENRDGAGLFNLPAHLFHWNDLRGTAKRVACADWLNTCSVSPDQGAQFTLQIAHPNLVVKPAGEGPGGGIADEVLYCVWTQFGPTATDCATQDSAGTLGGYVNGELYVAASSNDGLSWDNPVNITGTETPDCLPGACRSEGWVSAAAYADSGIYVSYLEDRHAGSALYNPPEGRASDNPYRIYVPATRPVATVGRICLEPSGLYNLNIPAGGAEQFDLFQVINIGTGTLGYTVRVTPDDGGRSHVEVNGDTTFTASMPAGALDTLIVGYDAIGLTDTTLTWRLEITSDDPINDPGQGGVVKNFLLEVSVTAGTTASISGSKFNDLNGNGAWDIGPEPGLGGWTIRAEPGGHSAVTFGNGSFAFAGLTPGTYTISEDPQSGWQRTFPGGAGTHVLTVSASEVVTGILFGNKESSLVVGDANGDGVLTSSDVIFLVNHIFKGGIPPNPPEAGDVNCDSVLTSSDIIFLVNHIFKGGPAPSC